MYQIVEEEIIAKAALELAPLFPDNSFAVALEHAGEFKRADLTPIFILDHANKAISVTTKEALSGGYH